MYIEEIEEYEEEYYEEEIVSYYDTGLSTILEGDNESSSSSSQQRTLGENGPQSPQRVPDQISLSSPKSPGNQSPGVLASLVSPTLFSPMAEARKLKFNSCRSPMGGGGRSKASPSPGARNRKSPTISNMPLVLTNLETGEEVVMEGDDDDYTFISCDTESIMGTSASNLEDVTTLDPIPLLDEPEQDSPEPTEYKPRLGHNKKPQYIRAMTHHPPKMDFDATKLRIEDALQRRVKQGKLGVERLDYVRRKLRYDLNRRKFKEQLHQCVIPSKRRNGK